MSRLYIAYGSNLNLAQMAARCPSARIFSTGRLNNWELLFRGSPGNSHATIRRRKGSSVPVLVWTVKEIDEYHLDIYEGFPTYYFKANIMVEIHGKKKKAMVYIMNESRRPGRPSASYIETIRQGYVDNSFDLGILEKALRVNKTETDLHS